MKAERQCFKSNLGLVCITVSDAVRFKTITRKRLLSFDEQTQQTTLRNLYRENLDRLKRAVQFCFDNGINLYRMTSALFPFADEPIGATILDEFADELLATGQRALSGNLRLVLHPDQFVVLSSDSEPVIQNSIKILKMHARTMDLLGQPRSEWAAMNIHGGKADRADRLVETVRRLPDEIRTRITFENDEYAYGGEQILDVCRRAGVPMVFDAHHHIIHKGIEDYNHPSVEEMFWAARETWKNPENQMVHISNGRERMTDRAHSDLIYIMPEVFRHARWIEVEAKHKELAIEKLQTEWIEKKAE